MSAELTSAGSTMADARAIDTYLGHLRAGTRFENEQLAEMNKAHPGFPDREHFLEVGSVAALIRKSRLRHAVVMSLGRWFDPALEKFKALENNESLTSPPSLFYELNEAMLNKRRKPLPGHFLPFAIISGNQPDRFVPSLLRTSDVWKGVKISACTTLGPDDPDYDGIYHAAEAQGWPVMVHCSATPGSNMTFKAVLNIARRYPQVTFTASHLGGDNLSMLQENVIPALRPEAGPPPNLFLNTAINNVRMVREVVTAIGADRVVFASDHPFTDSAANRAQLQRDLSPADFRKITVDNPARALRLSSSGRHTAESRR